MMITIFGPPSVFIELEELYAQTHTHTMRLRCVRDDLFACVFAYPGHDTRDDRFATPAAVADVRRTSAHNYAPIWVG